MSAAPALRVAAPALAPRLASLLALTSPAPLQNVDKDDVVPKYRQQKALKSFKLHIGGEITLPTRFQAPPTSSPSSSPSPSPSTCSSANDAAAVSELPRFHDPFEGVPLRAWAEKLGEKVMPAYEAVKAEETRRKAERALLAKSGKAPSPLAAVAPLSVPSVFPLTRWAASSPAVRSTLVAAEDPKDRPKARLSWYHPDDTMVPRDWFKGGLLKDLEYYRPFRSPVVEKNVAVA